ncbi:hypothetical protein ACOMHN_032910 [Nucella lapillus]
MATHREGTGDDESVISDDVDHESFYEVRKRIRAQRRRSTQEQIRVMKVRQRHSETLKKRTPYVQITCSAIAAAAAFFLAYRIYTSAS